MDDEWVVEKWGGRTMKEIYRQNFGALLPCDHLAMGPFRAKRALETHCEASAPPQQKAGKGPKKGRKKRLKKGFTSKGHRQLTRPPTGGSRVSVDSSVFIPKSTVESWTHLTFPPK